MNRKLSFTLGALVGFLAGAFLTYGLMPLPRVTWSGPQHGALFIGGDATFDCIGIAAVDGAFLDVAATINIPRHWYPCQGWLRDDGLELVQMIQASRNGLKRRQE